MSKINSKEKIIEVGTIELQRNGYNATGVLDITTAAGIPKGSFYNYFKSKEALGAEIINRYGNDPAHRQVLGDKSIAPRERLRLFFTNLNEMYIAKDFLHGCLLGNMSAEVGDSSPLIRKELSDIYDLWTKDIALAIADGQANGDIPYSYKSENLAIYLLDAWEGAVLRTKVDKHRHSLDTFLDIGLVTALV